MHNSACKQLLWITPGARQRSINSHQRTNTQIVAVYRADSGNFAANCAAVILYLPINPQCVTRAANKLLVYRLRRRAYGAKHRLSATSTGLVARRLRCRCDGLPRRPAAAYMRERETTHAYVLCMHACTSSAHRAAGSLYRTPPRPDLLSSNPCPRGKRKEIQTRHHCQGCALGFFIFVFVVFRMLLLLLQDNLTFLFLTVYQRPGSRDSEGADTNPPLL